MMPQSYTLSMLGIVLNHGIIINWVCANKEFHPHYKLTMRTGKRKRKIAV